MGGLTGYLFPQPIRDSVFSTERGLEYLSKGHNSTRDKKRRSMVDPPLLPDVLRERELASRLNLSFIAMAIHLSLRVAPLDLQQGGNSRIPPMWGTFWVWDARLTSVFISFLIYLGALCFQKLPVEPAPISIRAGPIDIPIIKSSVNWWNTSHQPGSISRSGTSIHVPMPIPILSNFANSPLSTPILFVLETRLPIPSFLESPLKEEIEAREGIPKPSSLAESLCIHG
ncbi:UNVERIFIED_CONTAM: putative cytochrome c biosynthesis ccmC-like mitochondrial protein [Sesamum calycinum]|uniref:Cytochrome c biosynthesis ccmC-like mitochondrial protein n=1 Tax=Sesamum calycinum TaxID=2727403 RepID=A0AAW2JN29_9LAMI